MCRCKRNDRNSVFNKERLLVNISNIYTFRRNPSIFSKVRARPGRYKVERDRNPADTQTNSEKHFNYLGKWKKELNNVRDFVK